MNIRAVYVGDYIDINELFRRHFRDSRHALQRRNIVISLEDRTDEGEVEVPMLIGKAIKRPRLRERFVVFHDYGGVVFFNCDPRDEERMMDFVTPFVTGLIDLPKDERFMLGLDSNITKWCEFHENCVVLSELDMQCVRIVSLILARSVALDHYERETDAMLTRFRLLNGDVAATGQLSTSGKTLFQTVAIQNQMLADIIQRLNILDRARPGDATWEFEAYERLWEGMADEFSLGRRFENLTTKVDLVKHNAQFFIDIQSNRHSDRLEWMIIVLITAELSISIADHWGSFIAYAKSFFP